MQKGGTIKEEKDLCYDIPLLESLQNLMKMEVVRDQVRMHGHFHIFSNSIQMSGTYH